MPPQHRQARVITSVAAAHLPAASQYRTQRSATKRLLSFLAPFDNHRLPSPAPSPAHLPPPHLRTPHPYRSRAPHSRLNAGSLDLVLLLRNMRLRHASPLPVSVPTTRTLRRPKRGTRCLPLPLPRWLRGCRLHQAIITRFSAWHDAHAATRTHLPHAQLTHTPAPAYCYTTYRLPPLTPPLPSLTACNYYPPPTSAFCAWPHLLHTHLPARTTTARCSATLTRVPRARACLAALPLLYRLHLQRSACLPATIRTRYPPPTPPRAPTPHTTATFPSVVGKDGTWGVDGWTWLYGRQLAVRTAFCAR